MHFVARPIALSLLLGAACIFTASAGQANPVFPGQLKANVPMPCLNGPGCTLCHNTDQGGPGNIKLHSMGTTWVQPQIGLVGADANSLVPALNNARAQMQDTDGDTIPDTVELAAGEDPNNPTPGALWCGAGVASSGPVYGCGRVARRGPIDSVGAVAAAVVAAIGLFAARRRGAAKKPNPVQSHRV